MPHLAVIAGALWRERRLEIWYREASKVVSRRVDPRGLVLKAGVWYLLAERRGEERVYRVSRIVAARERHEPSARPPGFDLAEAWAARSVAFERGRAHVEVTVRVPTASRRYLRNPRVVEEDDRVTAVVRFEGLDHAFHSLLSWGAGLEVLAPPELREKIATAAAETAALYAQPA